MLDGGADVIKLGLNVEAPGMIGEAAYISMKSRFANVQHASEMLTRKDHRIDVIAIDMAPQKTIEFITTVLELPESPSAYDRQQILDTLSKILDVDASSIRIELSTTSFGGTELTFNVPDAVDTRASILRDFRTAEWASRTLSSTMGFPINVKSVLRLPPTPR